MSDWDFGGAYADTAGKLQTQEQLRDAFPTTQAHTQALTRLATANAENMEGKNRTSRDMAKEMQNIPLDTAEDQASATMKMAGAAMRGGDPTTAQALILGASRMATSEARMAMYEATKLKTEGAQRIQMADRYARLLGGVTDQGSLDRANMIFASEFGEAPPQMRYDAQSIAQLRQSAVSMRDQAYIDHTKALEAAEERRSKATSSYRTQLLELRRIEEERRKQADLTRSKNGGKDVGAPQKGEVSQATDLLEREGLTKGLDPTAARTAAFDLASSARAMRKQNPGLSADEAFTRALIEQRTQGYYETKKETSLWGLGPDRSTVTYGKPGASPNRPLAYPKDAAARQPNTYYQTPKGPMLYLGPNSWAAPKASASAGPSGGAALPDDEDDGDDEE